MALKNVIKTLLFCNFIMAWMSCKISTNELTTNIIEVEHIENPVTNFETYHHKDVKVFKHTSENKTVYALTIFIKNKDSLKSYVANVYALNTFDKATYQWVNDSTVTFILKNKFHNHKPFTITGYGSTTSLSWE